VLVPCPSQDPELSAPAAVAVAWRLNLILRPSCILRTDASSAIWRMQLALVREQEARPGVGQRDEVLHAIERAQTKEQAHAAAHSFVRWLEELGAVE
jgi:hypothetical protein